MTKAKPKPETEAEEEDWSTFATADYGESYDPWADMVPVEEETPSEDEFEFEEYQEFRPAPAPEGIAQLVKMGCCDWCLARLCGGHLDWSVAEEDGKEIRRVAIERAPSLADDADSGSTPPPKSGGVDATGADAAPADYCPFCEELFADISLICKRISEQLSGVEFAKLQIGAHFAKVHVADEELLRTRHGAQGSRALKAAFSDAVYHSLKPAFPDAEFVKELPEVMLLIDTLTLETNVDIRSLYLYGRYRKLERGIPQTRWPCRACKGRGEGCESCEGSGQQYPTSVQDQIGEPLRAAYTAADTSFHGMGREDIDVRCLGSGRPFVIELKSPQRRVADLVEMTELVNATSAGRVEVSELRSSRRSEVARVKGTAADKSYTIRFKIKAEETIEEDRVFEVLEGMVGVTLEQKTPQRVAHRRADKIRKRDVVSVENIEVEGNEVQMLVRVQSGTYVKELIHSDEGRTVPSVAGLLEAECEVIWLDVEDVHAD
jgi:tRNA pseudouridine synthase 10